MTLKEAEKRIEALEREFKELAERIPAKEEPKESKQVKQSSLKFR